jgi:hypothetical protein
MIKRPSILYIVSLVALLVLVALALGPGRSLVPQRGASREQPQIPPNVSFQLENLTAPPSDHAIDWGIFRVIPAQMWQQENSVLRRTNTVPDSTPFASPSPLIDISSTEQAKSLFPIFYEPNFVPSGFFVSQVEGRKTGRGAYPVNIDQRQVVTTYYDLTVTYRHGDGRQFSFTQGIRDIPVPIDNPVDNPRREVRLGMVQTQNAVFDLDTANVVNGDASIRWGSSGIYIDVRGKRTELETLFRVAESVKAGG